MDNILLVVGISGICSCLTSYFLMNLHINAVDRMTTNHLIRIQDITNEYLDELRKKAK